MVMAMAVAMGCDPEPQIDPDGYQKTRKYGQCVFTLDQV